MHDTTFLAQTVLLFGAALTSAWLFRVLRAPSVIGFLFSGILIGPSGLRLITQESVSQFAELGLVLLLFTIGLELSPEPLIRSGRRLMSTALLQIVVIGAIGMLAARYFGKLPWSSSTIIGSVVALSSTAIVLKQLSDRRQADTPAGVLITGILLLQDVLAIVVMLVMPMLGTSSSANLPTALLKGGLSLGGLIVVTLLARRVLPIVIHQLIGKGGRELTTLFCVMMACSGALLAGLAGWSWGLGACIAGLLLSQSDMRHQLFADIIPFRDVFNAIFFITMGMLVDVATVINSAPLLALLIVATLVIKAFLTSFACLVTGWPLRLSIHAGLGLACLSEFGYVLALQAKQHGFLSVDGLEFVTAYTVGTMILGAMLVPIAAPVADAVALRRARAQRYQGSGGASHSLPKEAGRGSLTGHVVIIGYGLNGQNLSRVLRATKIPHCVVEMNRSLAQSARDDAGNVIVGDAAHVSILEHAGVREARALVVAINDPQGTRRIVAQARSMRPDLYILARTRYVAELDVLYSLGAKQVIPEEFETSIEIFTHVLKELAVPDNVIDAQIEIIRAGRYGMLRGRPARPAAELAGLLEASATQTFLIGEESPAGGRTIREVDLRAQTGVTIIAVVRAGKATTNPPTDYRMELGDVLVLVGGHAQLDAARAKLSPPSVL